MALEKEARTNFMGPGIDKRNRNWDKVSAHLADTMPHGMAQLKSSSGYVKLPGGMILQWGKIPEGKATNVGGALAYSFPTSFNTTASVSLISRAINYTEANKVLGVESFTNSNFTVATNIKGVGTYPRDIYFIAIGY